MPMTDAVLFSLFASESLTRRLADLTGLRRGEVLWKRFPDQESYLRFSTPVEKLKVVILTDLSRPDEKVWPLLMMAEAARDLGATGAILVAPYLPYMRQDIRFRPGEAISSRHFARLLSRYFDGLITVDPHLHRYASLSEIYSIPTAVGHAALPVARWIRENVRLPLLVGPDSESEQWVSEVAREACEAFLVQEKTRRGDRDVEVSIPDLERWKDHTPVVLDDIISTAQTMIQTVCRLRAASAKAPMCVGVHPIFADQAYDELLAVGAERVATCNTIEHASNLIDLSPVLADETLKMFHSLGSPSS